MDSATDFHNLVVRSQTPAKSRHTTRCVLILEEAKTNIDCCLYQVLKKWSREDYFEAAKRHNNNIC
jgi:hypothetical protein